MIELIVKSYFSILFGIGVSCLSILLIGMYLIIKKSARSRHVAHLEPQVAADLTAIAGNDLFDTQLDLARAFIDTEKKLFAKKILESILEDGNPDQQQEARALLGQL